MRTEVIRKKINMQQGGSINLSVLQNTGKKIGKTDNKRKTS